MTRLAKLAIAALLPMVAMPAMAGDGLTFDATAYQEKVLTFPDGVSVKYRAYEKVYYVSNVADSTYQCLNFYVPEKAYYAGKGTPILFRNYVSGYAAARPKGPDETDASGRALREGYVLCIPGARGSGSTIKQKVGKGRKVKTVEVYDGRCPNGLLDLKAAIRFLRYNDAVMPGDAEMIISDGASAGGAMSSLLGATGNHPMYAAALKEMGAADTRDDIFASAVYCPIIDLEHADMAYEWLLGYANGTARNKTPELMALSKELAAGYPAYVNSLNLTNPYTGEKLTGDNYMDYIKSYLIKSIQRGRDEGAVIPDTIGVKFYEEPKKGPGVGGPGGPGPRGNRGPGNGPQGNRGPGGPGGPGMMMRMTPEQSQFILDLDMEKYIKYVATTQPLKNAPAFDSKDVLGGRSSAENNVFGSTDGQGANFTDRSLKKATGDENATISDEMRQRVYMYNPLKFVGNAQASNAPYWFIRQGARDATFYAPVTLATMLQNKGKQVNFAFTWNRPHSGDFHLEEMFKWIKKICK